MWGHDYKKHAYSFLKRIYPYVDNWKDADSIIDSLDKMFWNYGKSAYFEMGSSRMVIVGKDFVIKWDYDEKVINEIGGCEEEFQTYIKSLSTGYSHLLAPIYRFSYRNKKFYIMPRVHNIGLREHGYKKLKECVTLNEWKWLINNIGDIHSYNWGIENNYPVMIDYACRPSM